MVLQDKGEPLQDPVQVGQINHGARMLNQANRTDLTPIAGDARRASGEVLTRNRDKNPVATALIVWTQNELRPAEYFKVDLLAVHLC